MWFGTNDSEGSSTVLALFAESQNGDNMGGMANAIRLPQDLRNKHINEKLEQLGTRVATNCFGKRVWRMREPDSKASRKERRRRRRGVAKLDTERRRPINHNAGRMRVAAFFVGLALLIFVLSLFAKFRP
ncbi:MAG: hypothetical protein ACJASX_002791 [Limisphaerales bacterium]|jgi:hypothetical protein